MENNIQEDFNFKKVKISKEKAKILLGINKDNKEKNEILREDMHNAYDEKANKFYVTCEYDNKEQILSMFFKHDGNPFNTVKEIISSLFDVGKSNKKEITNIGNKGVGNKLNLSADKLVIESNNNKEKIIIVVFNALKQLQEIVDGNKKEIELKYKVLKKSINDHEVGVKINLTGVGFNNLLTFSHLALIEYIKFFTIMGPVGIGKREFEVYVKGLVYTDHKINKNDENDKELNNNKIINNSRVVYNNSIKTKDSFDKIEVGYSQQFIRSIINENPTKISYYNDEGVGFKENREEFEKINTLCNSLEPKITFSVFHTIDKKIKEKINPLVKDDSIISINQREFFGIYAAYNNIVIPIPIKNLPLAGGGNASVQYLGFFQYDGLYIRTDRNDVGGTKKNTQFENTVKEIMRIISKIIEKKRQKQKSKSSNKNENNKKKAVQAYLNKKKLIVTDGNSNKVQICESAYEIEVYNLFNNFSFRYPEILNFVSINMNPYDGIDMLCIPYDIHIKKDKTFEEIYESCFWVEIKHILGSRFNHKMEEVDKIICWEIEKSLRFGKNQKVIDKDKIEYYLNKAGEKYELINIEDENKKIEVLELKAVIESTLKQRFR